MKRALSAAVLASLPFTGTANTVGPCRFRVAWRLGRVATPRHLAGLAVVLSLVFPAFADARRVSVWIEPVDDVNNNAGSRLAEHVRVSLPGRGRVKLVWPGAVWVDGRCRVEIGAQAREQRKGARFTISAPYAQWPFVSVSVDASRHCPAGTHTRILRSARLDAHRAACTHDGTKVAQNQYLRVYDQPPFRKVCALASRRRFDLGYSRGNRRCDPDVCHVGATTIAGRLFAYSDEFAGRRASSSSLYVRDGLTGRELLHVQSGTTCDETYEGGPVSSLVLRADGAVAWVVEGCPPYAGTTYEVRTPNGVVASGADIDGDSLRLTADGITWMQGGSARSAPL
jgi:hypothetical protein